MAQDGSDRAVEVVRHYRFNTAAPMVAWGVALTIATPALAAIGVATGGRVNPYTGVAAGPNPFFVIVAVLVGIVGAALLIGGCWRAAQNADYVAATTLLRVNSERAAAAAARRQG